MSKKYQLVRYKGKMNFEVACNPGTVLSYREGKLAFSKVPFSDEVYKNFSKGEVCLGADLEQSFETQDKEEVFKIILEKGEYQLSTRERREMLDVRKREVVAYIHRNFVNPQTKLAHPELRVEQALKQVKYQIVATKSAAKQVEEMFSQLCEQIPLKKDRVVGVLFLKHQYVGMCQGILHDKNVVILSHQRWAADGCEYTCEVAPGDYDNFFQRLHGLTKGDFNFKIEGADAAPQESGPAKKRGGGGGRKKKKKKKGGGGGKRKKRKN